MENLVTTDTIISYLRGQIESKLPIDPHLWMDGAMKLNVLLQGEQEKLFELEQKVAELKKILLEDDKTVAYAKTMVEASNECKEMKKQKAKIDRVIEFIRLAKQHSRTASELMRNSLV